jgi:hypothetical protein
VKKTAVLAGLLLLAAAAALSVARRRSVPETVAPAPVQQQYSAFRELGSVPPRSGPPQTYGPLPTVGLDSCMKGPCPGGSVNEILSAHGRIWGYLGSYRSFEDADSSGTYRLLASYLACVGLSRVDPAFCDYLPAAGSDSKGNVPLVKSPNYECRLDYSEVSFSGYAAGADKDESGCGAFLSSGRVGLGGGVTRQDFCAAASSGLGSVCAGLSKFVPKDKAAACLGVFPGKPSDCASGECLSRLATYEALKARDPGACPADRRELCSAYLSRSDSACSTILAKLGAFYCEALVRATKRANGYPGYSPDEVKAAIAEQTRRRAVEDFQNKENQRIIEENNRKVKALLGK